MEYIFKELNIEFSIINSNLVRVIIDSKNEIPNLINMLTKNNILLYEFVVEKSLENFYLELIDKH